MEDVKAAVSSVQSSVELARGEVSHLHKFMERGARDLSVSKPSILGEPGSASARPPAGSMADGPTGHRVDQPSRELGFGHVYVQTQLPTNGAYEPSHPKSSRLFGSPHDVAAGAPNFWGSLGHLPKMHFPKFNGDNPKLWISRCEDYFEMYMVDPVVWIRVAAMHFTDAAARWLQSVESRIRNMAWSEFCTLLLERFARDHHELLIRQLFHIKQTSTVAEYIERFTALIDQLHAYESRIDPLYYTMRFIDGLRDELKLAILIQRPRSLDTACVLAQLQDEVAPGKKETRSTEFSAPVKTHFKLTYPLPPPPPPPPPPCGSSCPSTSF
ncbi:hypothetical protein QOZ80_4AG0325910 [Eleusine coracana subsp. coracana]|nr:hypothetical protein QOZ80_4AG0325910 [Eleusine coracana subsp. coracana]